MDGVPWPQLIEMMGILVCLYVIGIIVVSLFNGFVPDHWTLRALFAILCSLSWVGLILFVVIAIFSFIGWMIFIGTTELYDWIVDG